MNITPLRVGLIGSGFMGEVHSRAARAARAAPVGVAASNKASAARAASVLGFEKACDSVEALLEDDDIDVIHVVTPNSTHVEFALAAIEAGKHVLCEKPLATSTLDARRLAEAASVAGVIATVPFVYRFHPMVREARARVASGETGRLLSIQGSYLQDWMVAESDDNWRVDEKLGGPSRAFADIRSHLCDLTEFVTDDRISRVQATKRTVFSDRATSRNITTEDLVAVLVETSGGAVGTLLVSQVAPGRKNRLHLEISGAAETIGFDQEEPETLWLGRRTGSQLLRRNQLELGIEAVRLSALPPGIRSVIRTPSMPSSPTLMLRSQARNRMDFPPSMTVYGPSCSRTPCSNRRRLIPGCR
ncbi:MAG: Gfo/Idh/MocA family protein [Lacisediminihabitans sp.]